MPGLTTTNHDEDHERLENQPEVLKLWLPSQLPSEHRVSWCLPEIPFLEFRFRYAQADDTLADLRRHIKFLQLARDQNTKHIKSTSSTTRSQGILDGFRGKINRLASQYRYARQALLALDPQEKLAPAWKTYFSELGSSDLRAPVRDGNQPSEGRFQPSWIWTKSRAPPLPATTTPDPLSASSSSAPPVLTAPATVPVDQGSNDALEDGADFLNRYNGQSVRQEQSDMKRRWSLPLRRWAEPFGTSNGRGIGGCLLCQPGPTHLFPSTSKPGFVPMHTGSPACTTTSLIRSSTIGGSTCLPTPLVLPG